MSNSHVLFVNLFLFCLLAVGPPHAIGQDSLDLQRDSLLALLEQAPPSSETTVDIYNEISSLDMQDTVQLKKYASEAYDLANRINYVKGQLTSITNQVEMYYQLELFEECSSQLSNGLTLLEQNPSYDSTSIRVLHSNLLKYKGYLKIKDKEYYEAIELFNKAQDLLNESDFDEIGTLLLPSAYVFTEVGDYALAINMLSQAKPYFEKADDFYYLIISYNNTGDNYIKTKEYQKALDEFEMALALVEKHKSEYILGTVFYSKAYCQMELGHLDDAMINFERALEIYEEEGNINYAAYCRLFIARIKFIKTKDSGLLSEYQYASDIGKLNDDIELQQHSASAMAEAHTILGQYKEANTDLIIANQLKDSITDKELLLQLRSLNEKHRFESEKEKLEIKKSKEVLSNKVAYRNKIIGLLMGLMFIVIVSGLLIYKSYVTVSAAKQKLIANNTALQRTEARLSESNKEMQKYIDLNVELEQFAYIASHDIKAPLRTIQSFTNIIKKKYYAEAEDNFKVYFDFIQKGTNSLNRLIDDLLEYSKSSTKKLNIEQFQFRDLLDEVIELLDFSLTQVNGKIEIINCDFQINADQIKLKQILQNLLSNALKFIDESRLPRVVVEATHDTDHTIITIKDNGIGVEEKNFEEIFEKFAQLNSKSKYDGTGLGLAICAKYVKEHNGEIYMSRNTDHGVTVTFTVSKHLASS